MKIKSLVLIALISAITTSISFAQSKTKAVTADTVVKNLYAAQKAGSGPFFQTKKRALVDRYFVKDLADMIWKDAVDAKGEVGAIDFDPLYGSQDPQITNFVVGKPRDAGGVDNAFVPVTFKNGGKADKVDFELARDAGKTWKIVGIYYGDGEDLASYLRYWQDEEFKKEYENQPFKGEYMVGTTKCTVTPTLGGFSTRIECAGQEGFKLYQVEGTETETAYIYVDEKGVEKGKFIFKNGETDGKFFNAPGKAVKVTRMQAQSKTCGLNLYITETNIDGLPVQNATATAVNAETNKTFKATFFEAMPVFDNLSEGKYQITVVKSGYKTAVKEIKLDCSNLEEDDQSVSENIFLQKGKGK